MDRVRLGRALGYGARHAAKTLQAVAEAATAPDPGAGAGNGKATEAVRPVVTARSRRAPEAAQVRAAGRSVWGPLATFSGALWLRVTGVFFGLVACAMWVGFWRLRGVLRVGGDRTALAHFWMFAGFGLLFGYFAVSGFLRARRKERRGR